MGSYGNTFWANLTFEKHSVIWAVTSWNLHCTMYSKRGLLMYTGPMMYFDRRLSAYALFGEWSILTRLADHENPSQNIDEACLCRAKVDKPRHPRGMRIFSISWTYLCSADLKSRHSLRFWAWVRICYQRLAAWVRPTALLVTSFELHVGIP